MQRRERPRPMAEGLVVALVALGAIGCSSGSDPSPSTGVDELVVPTPSPDPADFVATIDNPWFVLDDATFAQIGDPIDDPADPVLGNETTAVERTVEIGPAVAGVATTAVTIGDQTDLYAQDGRGNVWWFGREGEWLAGSGDAQAGLAMSAEPRRGDGFLQAEVPDEDLRAEVLEVDANTVVIGVADGAEMTRTTYTRGVGLELVETLAGEVVLVRQVEGE